MTISYPCSIACLFSIASKRLHTRMKTREWNKPFLFRTFNNNTSRLSIFVVSVSSRTLKLRFSRSSRVIYTDSRSDSRNKQSARSLTVYWIYRLLSDSQVTHARARVQVVIFSRDLTHWDRAKKCVETTHLNRVSGRIFTSTSRRMLLLLTSDWRHWNRRRLIVQLTYLFV